MPLGQRRVLEFVQEQVSDSRVEPKLLPLNISQRRAASQVASDIIEPQRPRIMFQLSVSDMEFIEQLVCRFRLVGHLVQQYGAGVGQQYLVGGNRLGRDLFSIVGGGAVQDFGGESSTNKSRPVALLSGQDVLVAHRPGSRIVRHGSVAQGCDRCIDFLARQHFGFGDLAPSRWIGLQIESVQAVDRRLDQCADRASGFALRH